MQKYGTISSASDLAIILGCEVYQGVSMIDRLSRSCQSVTSSYYEEVFKLKSLAGKILDALWGLLPNGKRFIMV